MIRSYGYHRKANQGQRAFKRMGAVRERTNIEVVLQGKGTDGISLANGMFSGRSFIVVLCLVWQVRRFIQDVSLIGPTHLG